MAGPSTGSPAAQDVLLPDAQFQRHLDAGRLMLQRPRDGAPFHYPRLMEPGTGSTDLEWFEASGRGTVYSTTIVRTRPPEQPYNVALVDLAEGPRVTTRVIGIAPDQVRIGMAVRARIDTSGELALLLFEPEPQEGTT